MVSERMARRTASGSTRPVPSTGRSVNSKPRDSRKRAGSSTAWCSTGLMMRCRPRPSFAYAAPMRAKLSASVAPLVKTISSASRAPIVRAMLSRASSTACRALCPKACTLLGLPNRSRWNGCMASSTRGSIGVVEA